MVVPQLDRQKNRHQLICIVVRIKDETMDRNLVSTAYIPYAVLCESLVKNGLWCLLGVGGGGGVDFGFGGLSPRALVKSLLSSDK